MTSDSPPVAVNRDNVHVFVDLLILLVAFVIYYGFPMLVLNLVVSHLVLRIWLLELHIKLGVKSSSMAS